MFVGPWAVTPPRVVGAYSVAVFWFFVVVAGLIVIFGIWAIGLYNGLTRKRVRAQNSLSQIDVQLKRRCDLIPNLVESVKGYMAHERQTLESVTAARAQALQGLDALHEGASRRGVISALAGHAATLDQLIGRLNARIEAYPDLKASANVLALQEELSSTENRIAFARQAYNDAVAELNTGILVFPANLLAGPFGFVAMELFTAAEGERAVPSVSI